MAHAVLVLLRLGHKLLEVCVKGQGLGRTKGDRAGSGAWGKSWVPAFTPVGQRPATRAAWGQQPLRRCCGPSWASAAACRGLQPGRWDMGASIRRREVAAPPQRLTAVVADDGDAVGEDQLLALVVVASLVLRWGGEESKGGRSDKKKSVADPLRCAHQDAAERQRRHSVARGGHGGSMRAGGGRRCGVGWGEKKSGGVCGRQALRSAWVVKRTTAPQN